MTTSAKRAGLRINSGVKAGGIVWPLLPIPCLEVRASLEASSLAMCDHKRRAIVCA